MVLNAWHERFTDEMPGGIGQQDPEKALPGCVCEKTGKEISIGGLDPFDRAWGKRSCTGITGIFKNGSPLGISGRVQFRNDGFCFGKGTPDATGKTHQKNDRTENRQNKKRTAFHIHFTIIMHHKKIICNSIF
ncbi:hypothetical protein [Methanoregula sp.]|uniref:hypothetical protein n=1 Tax=Methanoregula sp. TaxID=2052170 RepID=UPI0026373CEF|nr:hypothetical protein [Methanoregula sp.]MDD5142379.1 hypothetical protein [Methanoregula sp.]